MEQTPVTIELMRTEGSPDGVVLVIREEGAIDQIGYISLGDKAVVTVGDIRVVLVNSLNVEYKKP